MTKRINPKPKFFGSIVFKVEFIILIILLFLTLICTAQERVSLDSLQKQMDIRFINLFEAVDSLPEKSNRVYSTEFDIEQTRRIYVELNVINKLYDNKDHSHSIEWKWINPQGEEWGTSQSQFAVKKEWEWAYTSRGWGWSSPGNWTPGLHRAQVIIDDVWTSEVEFELTMDHIVKEPVKEEKIVLSTPKMEKRINSAEFYLTTPKLTFIEKERADEIKISTRSWGMDIGLVYLIRDMFPVAGEIGFGGPKDFDPFSQYVTSGAHSFDADSDFSMTSFGLYSGVFMPKKLINIEKNRFFSAGLNVGAKRFKAKRYISDCSDCNQEKFKFDSYLFTGPEIKVYFMGTVIVSTGYNYFFQGNDISGQVFIKIGFSSAGIE